MKKFLALGALTLAALVATGVMAEEPFKSGLQVGQSPTPFSYSRTASRMRPAS